MLTPDDGSPVLHMPISVAVPSPTIAVGSTNLTVNIPGGVTTQSGNLQIGNTGGPTLTVDTNYVVPGSVAYTLLDQPISNQYVGYYSTYDVDYAPYRFYAAQNFQVTGSNVNLADRCLRIHERGSVRLSVRLPRSISASITMRAASRTYRRRTTRR